MQVFKSNAPFSFCYAAFDGATNLNIQASIYDATSGTPALLATANLTSNGGGIYFGDYSGLSNKLYLVICVVYTDNTFTTVHPDYAPSSECFAEVSTGLHSIGFDYTAFDQLTGLFLGGSVYDVTSGTPALVQKAAMPHVAFGVYFGFHSITDGKSFLAVSQVFTDSGLTTLDPERAPGVETFQGYTSAAPSPSGAQNFFSPDYSLDDPGRTVQSLENEDLSPESETPVSSIEDVEFSAKITLE